MDGNINKSLKKNVYKPLEALPVFILPVFSISNLALPHFFCTTWSSAECVCLQDNNEQQTYKPAQVHSLPRAKEQEHKLRTEHRAQAQLSTLAFKPRKRNRVMRRVRPARRGGVGSQCSLCSRLQLIQVLATGSTTRRYRLKTLEVRLLHPLHSTINITITVMIMLTITMYRLSISGYPIH